MTSWETATKLKIFERPALPEGKVLEDVAVDVAPLRGVRIVEFGWVLAGTLPGMLLADLGAEVIKVESARRIDLNRQVPAINQEAPAIEQSPRFHSLNRGKLDITLDLAAPDSREVLKRLITNSQVVIENFSPGVLDKLQLGYRDLTGWRPDLIMASISAVGQTGPWASARGYALTVGALSGFSSLVGYDDGRPLGDELMCPDVVSALHAAVAVLAALHHHRNTGEGQYIDVSMYESMAAVLAEPSLHGTVSDETVGPMDVHDPSLAPHGTFPCTGNDNWVAISVSSEADWLKLCDVLGATDLAVRSKFRRIVTAVLSSETEFAIAYLSGQESVRNTKPRQSSKQPG